MFRFDGKTEKVNGDEVNRGDIVIIGDDTSIVVNPELSYVDYTPLHGNRAGTVQRHDYKNGDDLIDRVESGTISIN